MPVTNRREMTLRMLIALCATCCTRLVMVVSGFKASAYVEWLKLNSTTAATYASISLVQGTGKRTFLLENGRRHFIDNMALKSVAAVIEREVNISYLSDEILISYPLLHDDPVIDDISHYTSAYKQPGHWSNDFSRLIQEISLKIDSMRTENLAKYKDIALSNKLVAVYPTHEKDILVFRESILSALKHLTDVHAFFVIAPDIERLKADLNVPLPEDRVFYIDDSVFPITKHHVHMVMEETVRKLGKYKLKEDRDTPFQGALKIKVNWYLQQVMKLYIGDVLGLTDYIIIDSDIVFYKNITFRVNGTDKFYYAYTGGRNQNYEHTMFEIIRIKYTPIPQSSGIAHHMVVANKTLSALKSDVLHLHGKPLWFMMLVASAQELTCNIHRGDNRVCGSMSVLSEYEIYYHYGLQKFPATMELRTLVYTNGPAPGFIFVPPSNSEGTKLFEDSTFEHWKYAKALGLTVAENFQRQRYVDMKLGWDFVAYHSYAKRRNHAMLKNSIKEICDGSPLPMSNITTCSYSQNRDQIEDEQWISGKWWYGCICWKLKNNSIK